MTGTDGSAFTRGLGAAAFILLLGGFAGSVMVSSSTAPTAQRALLVSLLLGGATLEALQAGLERKRPGMLASPAALAVCAGCAIAGATGPAFFDCWEQQVWWMALAAGGAAVAALARDGGRRRGALVALLATLALVAVHGLAQRVYLYDLLRAEVPRWALGDELRAFLTSRRARSTFGQANGFAAFLVTLVPLATLATRGKGRLVLVALTLSALVASESRGGFIVVCGVAAGMAVFCGKRRLGLVTLGVLGAGLAALGVACLLGRAPATLSLRCDYWTTALRIIRDHPLLGVGASMYRWESWIVVGATDTTAWSRYPHQALLALWAEAGIVGPVVAAVLALRWRLATGAPREDRGGPRRVGETASGLVLAAAASVIAPGIHFAVLSGVTAHVVAVCSCAVFLAVAARLISRCLVMERAPLAVALGTAGFAAHAMVDLDLFVPGALATVTLLAATWRPPVRRPAGPAPGLVVALVLAVAGALWAAMSVDVVATESLCERRPDGRIRVARGAERAFDRRAAHPLRARVELVRFRALDLITGLGDRRGARALTEPWGPTVMRVSGIEPSDRPR